MTTILKATTKRLRNMINLLTLSKIGDPVFNPIVIEIVEEDGKEPYIQMQGMNSTHTVATIQKHRNIEIHQYEKSESHISLNGLEILDVLKIFGDEDGIEIEFGQDSTIIRDTENVKIKDDVQIPTIPLAAIESYDATPPFKTDQKGVIEIKNKNTGKKLKFDIASTIPVDYIRAQIKRANIINISPRLFQMSFQKNELKLIVGDVTDSYSKSVTSEVDIIGKGSGTCTYGDGYEAIFGSLDGNVLFMASEHSPAWITQKEDDHIVQFLLASAISEEDK